MSYAVGHLNVFMTTNSLFHQCTRTRAETETISCHFLIPEVLNPPTLHEALFLMDAIYAPEVHLRLLVLRLHVWRYGEKATGCIRKECIIKPQQSTSIFRKPLPTTRHDFSQSSHIQLKANLLRLGHINTRVGNVTTLLNRYSLS